MLLIRTLDQYLLINIDWSAIDLNPGRLCPELSFSHVVGICKASGAEMLFHLTKTQILIPAHLQFHDSLTAVEYLPEMLGQNSSPTILDCPHYTSEQDIMLFLCYISVKFC